jgi:hypothetical protein
MPASIPVRLCVRKATFADLRIHVEMAEHASLSLLSKRGNPAGAPDCHVLQ